MDPFRSNFLHVLKLTKCIKIKLLTFSNLSFNTLNVAMQMNYSLQILLNVLYAYLNYVEFHIELLHTAVLVLVQGGWAVVYVMWLLCSNIN